MHLPIITRRASLLLAASALAVGPAHGGQPAFHPRLSRPGQTFRPPRLAPAGHPGPAAAVFALVRKMLVAQNNLVLAGTMVSQTPQGSYTQYATLAGARAQRYDCLSPPANRGEVIVDNGRARYHVTPGGQVDVLPSLMSARRVRVPQVMQELSKGELRAQEVGQGAVAGHLCQIVRITPPYAGEWYQYWIDPTNGAQLRIEQYAASGQQESGTYFTNVIYHPQLAPGIFAPPRPAGTAIHPPRPVPQSTVPTAAQAGFTVFQPSYLPPGFHFQSSTLSPRQGKMLVKLTYGNALNALTLVETPDPSPQGPLASQIRRPRPDVALTRRGGLVIVLVGSLGTDILDHVLNSVR